MKTQLLFFTVLLSVSLNITLLYDFTTRPSLEDLEIYTDENIYHVDGLKLYSETEEEPIVFKSADDLHNYIKLLY